MIKINSFYNKLYGKSRFRAEVFTCIGETGVSLENTKSQSRKKKTKKCKNKDFKGFKIGE